MGVFTDIIDNKKRKRINDEKFTEFYKNFSGSDSEFAEFLNKKNIVPGTPGVETGIKGGGFTDKTVFGRRNRLRLKANVEISTNPKMIKQFDERNKILTKLVNKANQDDKYISKQQLSFMAEDKLGIKPKYDGEGRKPFFKSKISTSGKRGFTILDQLDTRVDKVDKVVRDLLVSESPQTEQLSKTIIKRTGITQPNFINIRNQVPSYKAIKLEAERLPSFLNKANNSYLLELPLAEQLTEVNTLIKGNPAYTYGKGKNVLKTVSTAREDAMKYALRSWNQNKGQGEIKFFEGNKKIPWEKGKRLKYGKVSFEYNGKKYNTSNLTSDVLKKDFKELYQTRESLNKFRGQKITNPFKKGQTIPVEKLIRKIQVDGYGWSPSFSTLDILHGPKGVKDEPFTNLRYNTKDINMVESTLSKNLASGKLNETEYKKAMANVNKPFAEGGEQAIINRLGTQAKKMKKGMFYGFEDLRNKELAKGLREAGFKCKFSAQSGGISRCDDPMNYIDDIKRNQRLALSGSSKAKARSLSKFRAVKGFISGTLGPGAIAFEAAVAAPFALYGYGTGADKGEIINDLTFGLGGRSIDERMKEEYGEDIYAPREFLDMGDRLSNLERLQGGTYRQKLRSKQAYQTLKPQFEELGTKMGYVDEQGIVTEEGAKKYIQDSVDLQNREIEDTMIKAERAKERKDDLTGLEAIGMKSGGLINLTTTVAPQSGPNSKGLESLRKYATKTY